VGGRLATISAAVLLGGRSSRMGRDKAHLPVAGVAAATRIGRLLAGLFDDVILVGGDAPADAPGRRVSDVDGPVCALRGLVSALDAARTPRLLVVATDLPLLSVDLLLALVAFPEADAVVPRSTDGVHPLCALYARDTVLPTARAHLRAGRLKLRDLLDAIDTIDIAPADLRLLDSASRALTNVNTPADLTTLESLL